MRLRSRTYRWGDQDTGPWWVAHVPSIWQTGRQRLRHAIWVLRGRPWPKGWTQVGFVDETADAAARPQIAITARTRDQVEASLAVRGCPLGYHKQGEPHHYTCWASFE